MKLILVDAEDETQFFAIAHREDTAINELWKRIRTDVGPLSTKPKTLEEFADAISSAFGGELSLVKED